MIYPLIHLHQKETKPLFRRGEKKMNTNMNTIQTNPFLTTILHALFAFAGACAVVFLISLLNILPVLTMAKDPGMMFILIAFPIIGGVSAFIKATA